MIRLSPARRPFIGTGYVLKSAQPAVGGVEMAYSELIKRFERIRDYMRQFYVYGFKSREEYDAKSARSYAETTNE